MAIALAFVSAPSCKRAPSRPAILESTVRTVVLPSYERLSATARVLTSATGELSIHPSPEALGVAQTRWREALWALEFTYAFRVGPIVDARIHLQEAFWPVRPAAIEDLIDSSTPLEDATAAKASAATKGLFAIEYLLFEGKVDTGAPPRLLTNERRRRWLDVLAREYERTCQTFVGAPSLQEFPKRFAEQNQAGVGLLVNSLVETVETVRALVRPLPQVVGRLGGATRDIALARLEGVRAHYLAAQPGLTTLVAAQAPALDRNLRASMLDAIAEVSSLPRQIDGAALEESLRGEQVAAAIKALEVDIKSGLPGALGVTLTFRSADGD